ncbi:unnamed protein product [Kuraishia capsulata CBS 1993]|uniref:Peroxisomal membrane protein 4 n=1 Tax=Kuraishia capsulata CBS 1993 TaxID=1382522 RepID=W6MY31_9ASCO|nr:uncharacterized protein KUCA_T00005919001 [Kuraishia capsulata CBS 1993]CDK29925.1 unnamed protein product [Kuraishia capsulata CBS 1993]
MSDYESDPDSDDLDLALPQIVLDALNMLRASRNGVVYGSRIRFAHAIAVSFIFRRNVPLLKRVTGAASLSLQHAKVLAGFAVIYRGTLYFLRRSRIFKSHKFVHFIAGAVAGFFVYGQPFKNAKFARAITHQVTLYLISRLVLALGSILAEKLSYAVLENDWSPNTLSEVHSAITSNAWTVTAALSWGACMYLYQTDPKHIHKSLRHSLDYMYNNDNWSGVKGFLGL